MGELIGLDPNDPYEMRLAALKTAGIALWDVLHSCRRKGSLDTSIETDSIVLNDFETFFEHHPHIKTICFNGATAQRYYNKHILPKPANIRYVRLPSTSPAHASLPFEQKIAIWRAEIQT